MFTQTDCAIRHNIALLRMYTLVAEMDILNLFNEKNELQRQTTISPNNITGGNLLRTVVRYALLVKCQQSGTLR